MMNEEQVMALTILETIHANDDGHCLYCKLPVKRLYDENDHKEECATIIASKYIQDYLDDYYLDELEETVRAIKRIKSVMGADA